jgi:hypothetical protein
MDPDVPAPSRLCASEFTKLPYEVKIAGGNKQSLNIWVEDQELAQRIGKALEHLIKASGGKYEVF